MPPETHASPQRQPSFLSGRFALLLIAAFGALAVIWPLSQLTVLWNWDARAALGVTVILSMLSGGFLLYRYVTASWPGRLIMSTAFWISAFASIMLAFGVSLLATGLQAEPEAIQAWSFFLPRVLLLLVLLIAAAIGDALEEQRGDTRTLAGILWFAAALLTGGLLVLFTFVPLPSTFAFGTLGRLQELLPFGLALLGLLLVLRRGQWIEQHFAYGTVWFFLLQTIASTYLLFAEDGRNAFGIVGFVLHAVALAIPILTVQSEMFRLYADAEQYRWQQVRSPTRFGGRGAKKELVTEVFRQAVEQSRDPLYITDASGRVVFVNIGFTALTGYTSAEVMGEMPDHWAHSSMEKGAYDRLFSQARLRKEPVTVTMQNRRKDGTSFEASIHISPIVNELGEVMWFIAREHDLSEVKERTLLLQQILDNMPLGICLLEVPSTKVLLSNHYADALLRRAGFQQIEQFSDLSPVLRLASGKPYPDAKLPVTEALRTKETAQRDDIQVWKAGAKGREMIWKMYATPLFDAQATLRHVLLSFDDITHQKELEHKMTDSISVASHQLRTPLTGIKWALDEYRKSEKGGMSAEDRKELFDTLYQATVRMFNVIQGLLDASKLEQGQVEVKPEPVRLDTLIASIIGEFGHAITEKKITVKQSVLHTIPEAPYDLILVRQILQNLIDNAVKYTPEGGEIDSVLSVERERIHWALHDTGIGIAKGEMDHLYTKFHRADNAQKVDAYGMGLGLFTVKSIVDLLGGEVRCESEEDHGTTFHVFFPITSSRTSRSSP